MERRIAPSARIEAAIEEVLLGGLDDAARLSELGRLGARLVIQRAVEDGATVPIYYDARHAKIGLDERWAPRIDPDSNYPSRP